MALKQDFWSTRDHITYFEPGLCLFKAIRHKATPMPVATGATKASLADLKFKKKIQRVFLAILLFHEKYYYYYRRIYIIKASTKNYTIM